MKRAMALLCLLALCRPAQGALAANKQDEEQPPAPYTQSASVYGAEGVTVTGTRAWVDYHTLRQLNQDTVGWLYQEETRLSQPILQGEDNELYQKRAFDMGILSNRGSVYIEAEKSPAMDEPVVVLHGSGRDGACLESLNEYKNQAYYDQYPSLRLLTPQGDYQADVFACIKTSQRAMQDWYPGGAEESFAEWRSRVLQSSEIQSRERCLPEAGERVLVLAVKNSGSNRRLVLAALRPIRYDTQADCNLTKAALDQRPTYSGRVQVGPLGQMMLYAQNDPIWAEMRYESEVTSTYRHFDGGGCGPTAAAIVVANLVDEDRLPLLRNYASNGMGTLMCTCSVNRVYCNHTHVSYLLESPAEYLRYLPVAMADFAAGNNQWGIISRPSTSKGSNMRFFDQVCEIYGLAVTPGPGLAESLEMLKGQAGRAVVLCYALRGSPFTNSSHYVVIAGVDDEYFYVLDPWRRTEKEYEKTDKRNVLEYICPGLVKISLENARKTDMTPVSYIQRTDVPKSAFGEE